MNRISSLLRFSSADSAYRIRCSRRPMAEALESRTFLSAWATVDTWQMIPGSTGQCLAAGMASDKAGNVYAAGVAADSNGIPHGIIREETNGVWSTVADVANAGFNAVTTDSAGDVFASGCKNPSTSGGQPPSFTSSSNWIVAERAAGKASFSVVNDPVSTANNATAYGIAARPNGKRVRCRHSRRNATTRPHQNIHPLDCQEGNHRTIAGRAGCLQNR